MNKILIPTFILFLSSSLLAHKPVLNESSDYPIDAPYEVVEPEISKAIFSTLDGAPHYYKITSERDFNFYVSVLAAKIEGCDQKDRFSFEVLDSKFHQIIFADGEVFEWWPWFEKYGDQWYWVGPEIGENFKSNRVFKAGTYYIKIFNKNNEGKYIFAVGDIEDFSFSDIFSTIFSMGSIEDEFWGKEQCG